MEDRGTGLARYVEDLALILPIISGVDWEDPAIVPMPLGEGTTSFGCVVRPPVTPTAASDLQGPVSSIIALRVCVPMFSRP